MEEDELCNELNIIFLECPIDQTGHAEVQDLVDAFLNKYGQEQPELRNIISSKLDPHGLNCSITRSYFKKVIMEWVLSKPEEYYSHPSERSSPEDREEVFEYGSTSCIHSTPIGRVNKRSKNIPQRRLSYGAVLGNGLSDSLTTVEASNGDEIKSHMMIGAKTYNSSLERSLVKAEQKICSLEEKVKETELNLKRELERLVVENNRLKPYEKLYSESVNRNEKYEETLNNLTKEYYYLKYSKDILDKDYSNLDDEFHRLKNELDSKNITLKTHETYKRVQNEELIVLQESKNYLECEVQKLKTDIKIRNENEGALMKRIGDLKFEKQSLQTEIDELANLEKMRMISSSPFQNILSPDDRYSFRDNNRESGISVRSELMDSMGYSPSLNDRQQQFLSILHSGEDSSFGSGPMYLDFNFERENTKTADKEIQTERIIKISVDVGTQVMITPNKRRETKNDNETQTESMIKPSFERGAQTSIPLSVDVETQTTMMTPSISENMSKNLLKNETKTDNLLKIDSEFASENILMHLSENETDNEANSSCFNSRSSPSFDKLRDLHWNVQLEHTLDRLTPSNMDIDKSLEDLNCNIVEGYCLENNQRIHSLELVPVLKNQNMTTPRMRYKRWESRRFSAIDTCSRELILCKPCIYEKVKFGSKLSSVITSIISIVSPGLRICLKTLLFLVAVFLIITCFGIVIITKRQDYAFLECYRPFLQLRYPNGSPPT